MSNVGARIATGGWKQGSIFTDADAVTVLATVGTPLPAGAIAIVASQSCDLAHSRLEAEPYAEVLIAIPVSEADGNFTAAKHPRKLHLPLNRYDGQQEPVELKPWHRHSIDRALLADKVPDRDRFLLDNDVRQLSLWLAQRYVRAALPDEFNKRISTTRRRRDNLHRRLSPWVSGLYFQLHPNRELEDGEYYHLNLLALIPIDKKNSLTNVDADVAMLAEQLRESGINVEYAVRSEDSVSYAQVTRMQRFPLEHLSLRGESLDPMPSEWGEPR